MSGESESAAEDSASPSTGGASREHDPAKAWERSAFVVFSDDWGRHPSSCQHLFRHILGRAPVMWVNTVGLRTPRLSAYDLKRAFEVLSGWLRKPPRRKVEEAHRPKAHVVEPVVIRPFMIPFFQWEWAKRFNAFSIARTLERALRGFAPGRDRVLISTLPIVPELFRSPWFSRKVYYCVDDFTTWPGVDGQVMRRLEDETLLACGQVIATSSSLAESRTRPGIRTALLTHGVDLGHFWPGPEHSPPTGPPVIGMFGVFDDRVDGPLLLRLAKRFQDATIRVIGPIDRDLAPFRQAGNIEFTGPVPYRDLPEAVSRFSVCILPYVVDASTHNINPLKLKEYLATGKPVVSTPLPEAQKLAPFVRVAGAEGFGDAVAQAMSHPAPERGLREFLEGESWNRKAMRFLSEIFPESQASGEV